MTSNDILFSGFSDMFEVTGVAVNKEAATIDIISQQNNVSCPQCGTVSHRLHSYYNRRIRDLPAFDNRVIIQLKSRKFHCTNPDCDRKIFTERFSDHFSSYQRVSDRLGQKLFKIALIVGGNAGSKLAHTLNIPVSASTLIRQIHRAEIPNEPISEAVGIDDWAFRKGVNYGTAIIDLNKRRVIDLLPNREADTIASWLREKPHIKVVTRDRYSHYAKGVTQGLPKAIQVVDRWHLLKNMGEALKKLLTKTRQELRRENREAVFKSRSEEEVDTPRSLSKPPETQRVQNHRDLLLQQIKAMHSEGTSIRQIAQTFSMGRVTIRKYLRLDQAPRKNEGKTNIQQFLGYIYRRMHDDKDIQVIQLWKEVTEMGYNGSRSVFYGRLKDYVQPKSRFKLPDLIDVSWQPAKVGIMLYQKEELLSPRDKKLLRGLIRKSAVLAMASKLTKEFRVMMETRQGDNLKDWVNKVQLSEVQELKGFAKSLLHDYQAVKNALTLKWSNGPVEGQINKLKTIKRQMYGRAGFDLLRKKVIFDYN